MFNNGVFSEKNVAEALDMLVNDFPLAIWETLYVTVLATLFAILGIGGLILYYLSGLPTQEIPNNIVEPETVASNISSPSKHENEEDKTDSCQEKSAGHTVISEPSRKNWTI